MNEVELFGAALGLQAPWRVRDAEFDQESGRLDLYLEFPRGSRFACPVEGCAESGCPVHDTEGHSWRHLDFFQHQAYLHARVPRVRCTSHGVHQVRVPWARPGSGFTLLFEALLVTYAKAMPVARIAAMTGATGCEPGNPTCEGGNPPALTVESKSTSAGPWLIRGAPGWSG